MPVTIPSNGVLTIRHEYLLGSDVSFNLLHYQFLSATVVSTGLPLATEPLASDILPTAANAAFAQWEDAWAGCASEQLEYTGVTAQKTWPGDRSTPYHYLASPSRNGDNVSESLPLQDAFTILKKSGYGQRWGMGRVFFSGIPESLTEAGSISTALRDNAAVLAAVVAANLTFTTGGVNYVFKPVITNVPTTGFPRVTSVTSASLSDRTIKTQRRRRPGKGM